MQVVRKLLTCKLIFLICTEKNKLQCTLFLLLYFSIPVNFDYSEKLMHIDVDTVGVLPIAFILFLSALITCSGFPCFNRWVQNGRMWLLAVSAAITSHFSFSMLILKEALYQLVKLLQKPHCLAPNALAMAAWILVCDMLNSHSSLFFNASLLPFDCFSINFSLLFLFFFFFFPFPFSH